MHGLPLQHARFPSIEGYEIVGVLATGGMGAVYEGRRYGDGKLVALKVLPNDGHDAHLIRRFDQEISITSMLDHPDIVRVFDSGWGNDYAWIAMELLDGFELTEAMPDRSFTLEERLSVMVRVALALHHAHGQGVIHRDVKPSNIFLTRDGGVRLLDFGVAKLRGDQRLTRTGKTVGTPRYMSPEQIMAQVVDARADVFGLGAVAYEVLGGSPAWLADNDHALMMAICSVPPRPFAETFEMTGWFRLEPVALQRLHTAIHGALAAEPSRRFANALDLAEALERVMMPDEAAGAGPGRAPDNEKSGGYEIWASRRLDWARARAARLRVESEPPHRELDESGPIFFDITDLESTPAHLTRPPAQAEDDDAPDRSTALWAALIAAFALGLAVALFLAFK